VPQKVVYPELVLEQHILTSGMCKQEIESEVYIDKSDELP